MKYKIKGMLALMLFVFAKAPLNQAADKDFDLLFTEIIKIIPQDELQIRLVEVQSTLHDLIEKHTEPRDQVGFIDNLRVDLDGCLVPGGFPVVFEILQNRIEEMNKMHEPVVTVMVPSVIPQERVAPAAAPIIADRAIDIEALKEKASSLKEKTPKSSDLEGTLNLILTELGRPINRINKFFLLSTLVYLEMNSEGSRQYNDDEYVVFEAKALKIWEGIKKVTHDPIREARVAGSRYSGLHAFEFTQSRQRKQRSEELALNRLLPYVKPTLRAQFLMGLEDVDSCLYVQDETKILPVVYKI